jgi:small-conductance mechanosensitive channel
VLNRLWVLFRDNDIVIPYPRRDVHLLPPASPSEKT